MIKIYNIVLAATLLLSQNLFSQAPDTAWTKVFGGERSVWGNSVQQTIDGGYIITGRKDSIFTNDVDVWLIKTDENGDTLWTKTFGGSAWDEGYSVQQTLDGGYIVCGFTSSFSAGGSDVWLIKTDENSDTLWTKTYGGSDIEYGLSVQQTLDRGYIVAGWTRPYDGWSDVWLIKTNENGDTLWTKTFGGSTTDDAGYSVQQTTDDGYIVCGVTSSSLGGLDVWLIKTDENGDTLWTKTFGGSSIDKGYSVQQTTDDGYIVSGRTGSFGASWADVWLIKTDENGDTLWTKTFGGSSADDGYSVQQTTDGGYIVCGTTGSFGAGGSDIWLIKTDENGDTLWTKTIGGSNYDKGYSVEQTTDRGYIVCGMTGSFGADNYGDVWLIKIKPDPPVVVENEIGVADHFRLNQNYPNPFNPTTRIKYSIPSNVKRETSNVSLKVYDVLGNEIATLVNEEKPAGSYEVEFSAVGGSASGGDAYVLTSGIYFYQLRVGESFIQTKKMILLK